MSQENQNPNPETSSNPPAKIDLEQIFATGRTEWRKKVIDVANMQRDIMKFTDTQIELFTMRQLATDQIHNLLTTHAKLNEKYKKKREEVRSLRSDFGSVKDANEYVDAGTASIKLSIDQINNQIDFFKETVKNIDSMIYGIKYRLEFETNYRRV